MKELSGAGGRRVILVTGAPRSATTPIGNALALASRTCAAYEPFGPTGLRGVADRFPMAGCEGELSHEALAALIDQIRWFRGPLKPQHRANRPATLRTRLVGSRTLHSFRLGRLQPWVRTVIWKDPHAVMAVPEIVELGVPVVVAARRPPAHAGSFKRLGWKSRAAEIYPRWRTRYGADACVERWLPKVQDPVVSGALIWRLSYLPLLRDSILEKVYLVTSDALMLDEGATYRDMFEWAQLDFTDRLRGHLRAKGKAIGPARPKSMVVHDWNRSVAAANSYWKELLDPSDMAAITDITGELEDRLFASPEKNVAVEAT